MGKLPARSAKGAESLSFQSRPVAMECERLAARTHEIMTNEIPERIVTIFGGAKCSEGDAEYVQARRVGQLLADAGFTICTGATWE